MASRVAERVVLDTNVLLRATDRSAETHARALATLDSWPGMGTQLYTSGQILREYLVVATRSVDQNGLGLDRPDALANVHLLMGRLYPLDENAKVSQRLLSLLAEVDCSGKQIHDANVVATMLTHGVDTVVTFNIDDFTRFEGHITVITP